MGLQNRLGLKKKDSNNAIIELNKDELEALIIGLGEAPSPNGGGFYFSLNYL